MDRGLIRKLTFAQVDGPVSLHRIRSAESLFRYNKEEIPGLMAGEL